MTRKYKTSDWDIMEAMTKYGGSFVKQLAVLYRLADPNNKHKLEIIFNDFFHKYDELADKDYRDRT
jgi:hypothetical protein